MAGAVDGVSRAEVLDAEASSLYRITLQGSALQVDGVWYLHW